MDAILPLLAFFSVILIVAGLLRLVAPTVIDVMEDMSGYERGDIASGVSPVPRDTYDDRSRTSEFFDGAFILAIIAKEGFWAIITAPFRWLRTK